ncbi:MAG TPA: hypothetical protein VEX13_16325 [Chloroflexia bacterium]|nr:hypothetical protein [Chloroflexia bacterium]
MSADSALIGRLDAFLAPHGTTREMIVAAVGEPYGRPLLVVATGSILHGYGNERSDIDINVVVERNVTQLPIPTFSQGVLLDTAYFGASEVKDWADVIRDQPWPPPGNFDRKLWRRSSSDLFRCTRLGYGLALTARDGWDGWMAEFREPWLAERVAHWWRIESARRQLGGRWLADAKPLLAAQRQFEAVLAALESRAASAGHPHSGPKWLSEKLRTLGDDEGLAVLREVMRAPVTEQEARGYIAQCEALLAELVGSHDGLAAQLWYLPGVKLRKLDARTLVSRWDMRGIELRGEVPGVPDPSKPIWEGGLDVPPPSNVLSLFTEDMTWLSIVARAT